MISFFGSPGQKFLSISGTSVPSERIFSFAGLAVTKAQARLAADSIDEVIFLYEGLASTPPDLEPEAKPELKIRGTWGHNIQQ